jgi:hypothetical protein
MKRNIRNLVFCAAATCFAFLLATWAGKPSANAPASATAFQIGSSNGVDTILCESANNRRNYCRVGDPRAYIELAQQMSKSPCVRGQTWGNDGQGIWVDRGCRARFRVTSNSGGGPGWWNSGGGHRPNDQPKVGACFFKSANFTGDYFCQPRGTNISALPPGFNDQISSIRIYGNAAVTIFNDANFSSSSITTRRSISDLRTYQLQGYSNKTWNNRISSLRVN